MSQQEEKRYLELMEGAPTVQQSAGTAQAAATLAAAEQAARNIDYSRTADARLDRAINEVLTKSGYKYDISRDQAYQDFAREYSQNALRGREAAQQTAKQLAGGYTPTYADTVGSEVSHDIVSNLANYSPSFRSAASREAADRTAQAMNTAQALETLANTDYSRNRDTVGDAKNFVNYLASRYSTERQADVQRQGIANDIWQQQLSGAQNNLNDSRQIENAQYLLGTQSAESRAKLAEDAYEFNQKQAYTAAKDAYDDRIAAQKAAETAAEKQAEADEKDKEKAKTNYSKMTDKIDKYINTGKGLSYTQLKEYDLDGNGLIDERDRDLAEEASETGSVAYTFDYTDGVNELIGHAQSMYNNLEKQVKDKNEVKEKFRNYLDSQISKYRITRGEAAALYEAFWDKLK